MTRKKKDENNQDTAEQEQPPTVEETPTGEEAQSEVGADESDKEGEQSPDYQALYEEAKEKLIRHCAEFENYRKRTQREYAMVRAQTKAGTIEEFLAIYDHFGMALSHSDENTSVLRQGMEMILAEFRRTFESLGVEELDAMGQPFDPDIHEAMAQEPSDDIPEGHVLRQWKAGFRMGDKLLRPATVVVSAGPATQAETTDDNEIKND